MPAVLGIAQLRRRGPSPDIRLNPDHPLSTGLVACASAGHPVEYVNGLLSATTAPPDTANSVYGQLYTIAGRTARWITLPSYAQPLTIAFTARLDGTNGGAIIGIGSTLKIRAAAAGQFGLTIYGVADYTAVTPARKEGLFVQTVAASGGNVTSYALEGQIGQVTVGNAGAMQNFAIGSRASTGTDTPNSTAAAGHLWLWNRVLSVNEIAALYDAPFQMFEARTRRYQVLSPAGGGATQALAGSITGTSTMSGTTLTMTYPLTGTVAAASTMAGTTPTMVYGLAGTSAAASTLSGTTLTMTYRLVGTSAATSSLTGALSLNGAVTDDPNKLTLTIRETGKTLTIRERA